MNNGHDDREPILLGELLEALSASLAEDTTAQFERERQNTLQVVSTLEETFKDRGLAFTSPFAGAMPVQAYGRLDGLRFYFRFRHNWASLKLGKAAPEQDTDREFFPDAVEFSAVCPGPTPDDHFNGWLSPSETILIFTDLANSLAPTQKD